MSVPLNNIRRCRSRNIWVCWIFVYSFISMCKRTKLYYINMQEWRGIFFLCSVVLHYKQSSYEKNLPFSLFLHKCYFAILHTKYFPCFKRKRCEILMFSVVLKVKRNTWYVMIPQSTANARSATFPFKSLETPGARIWIYQDYYCSQSVHTHIRGVSILSVKEEITMVFIAIL